MVYALLKPQAVGSDPHTGEKLYKQSSQSARDITGYLFSDDFERQGYAGLMRKVGDLLPKGQGSDFEDSSASEDYSNYEGDNGDIHYLPHLNFTGWSTNLKKPNGSLGGPVPLFDYDPYVFCVNGIESACETFQSYAQTDPYMSADALPQDTALKLTFSEYKTASILDPGSVETRVYLSFSSAAYILPVGIAGFSLSAASSLSVPACEKILRDAIDYYNKTYVPMYQY